MVINKKCQQIKTKCTHRTVNRITQTNTLEFTRWEQNKDQKFDYKKSKVVRDEQRICHQYPRVALKYALRTEKFDPC